jgi:hypothetical protein
MHERAVAMTGIWMYSDLACCRRLGRNHPRRPYEVIAPLAEGGMGAVFRAAAAARRRGRHQDRPAESAGTPGGARALPAREPACAQLRHPNIVSILDYNLDDEGRPFLVMELLNGAACARRSARGRVPIGEVQAIVGRSAARCSSRTIRASSIAISSRPTSWRTTSAAATRVTRSSTSGWSASASDSTRLTGAHEFVGTFTYARRNRSSAATSARHPISTAWRS